jgi:hypothetical protein
MYFIALGSEFFVSRIYSYGVPLPPVHTCMDIQDRTGTGHTGIDNNMS